MKKRLLFVCTHNSARSQMAEGLVNARYGDRYVARSAGTGPRGVHRLAVEVLGEIGIDISEHVSESVSAYMGERFDLVVTVCDHAKEECPFFPGAASHESVSFRDPADAAGSCDEESTRNAFRAVRDEIGAWLGRRFGADG